MAFQLVLSSTGPLPLKAQFSIPVNGSVDFFVTATAWTQTPNTPIGIQVMINGEILGSTRLYVNPAAQHMTLPTIFGSVKIADPMAQQTVTIEALNSTITDVNDQFCVWAQY